METVQTLGTSEYYYRDSIVISVFSNIYIVLEAIDNVPEATYNKFKKMLKISGGALHNRLKDAKLMGLYTNGHGKRLTDLGKRWRDESIQNKGLPSKEILKQGCLNVPLFNLMYNEDKGLISANKIFEFFKKHDPENQINDKFIKMAVKRYLEGIHNFTSQRRPRLKLFKTQSTLKIITPSEMGEVKFSIQELDVIKEKIKELEYITKNRETLKKLLEIL